MDGMTPIYVQIAEWLQNEILAERLVADGKVYSQYQLAELFNINPATAGKGLTLLLEEEIIYKKRGLGMFVTEQAKEMILQKRRSETLQQLARELVDEARRLALTDMELIALVQKMQRGVALIRCENIVKNTEVKRCSRVFHVILTSIKLLDLLDVMVRVNLRYSIF